MIGKFLKAAGKFLGGSGGGLFGGVLSLGSKILGWAEDNPIVVGHVAGAIGGELMRPTSEERAEEARRLIAAQEDERRKRIRANYGLPETPTYTTASIYTPRGLGR